MTLLHLSVPLFIIFFVINDVADSAYYISVKLQDSHNNTQSSGTAQQTNTTKATLPIAAARSKTECVLRCRRSPSGLKNALWNNEASPKCHCTNASFTNYDSSNTNSLDTSNNIDGLENHSGAVLYQKVKVLHLVLPIF